VQPATSSVPTPNPDASTEQLLVRVIELTAAKEPAKVLPLADEPIGYYEKTCCKAGERVYSARWPVESLLYVMQTATAIPDAPAKAYSEWWGMAYFLKGFALVDLQRLGQAKIAFDAATALAPGNSKYISERGNLEALQHNWPASLESFRLALEAVDMSPPELKTGEMTRALRGMAYAQIELKNLDEAEGLHQRVLQLDPTNVISLKELRYIRSQRARSTPR
jgi:tetratricopeptide (TPR) repeat protein